ncbi:SSI family serine proteinase inhibitor [Kitasatospora sp. NPDC093806]|uniref:SSI family serine proteinase inhibitor n=1 Tax=Kitasatospora sp. NPDC093806 TaxID=3155075 RepID=UPI003423BD52
MHTPRITAVAASVLLALALAPAASAPTASATTPETVAPAPAPVTSLRLTITPGEDHLTGRPRVVTLNCPPDSTTSHPDPVTACLTLDPVDGDLDELDVDPGPCTSEYAPFTVTASGTYEGRSVHQERAFGNRCTLLRTTGAVFDF